MTMGKTLRYGSKGNRVALQDRIARVVLHRRTAEWFEEQARILAIGVAKEVSPMAPQYITYRATAPGFGQRRPNRLPSR